MRGLGPVQCSLPCKAAGVKLKRGITNMAHRLRIGALFGACIAVALSFTVHAAGPAGSVAGTHYNLSPLKDSGRYDRFIVTWREGSAERASPALMLQNVGVALDRAGLARTTLGPQGLRLAPARAVYARRLATGADLLRTTRRLDRREATALMEQLARDPAVAHVAPDVLRQPVRDIAAPSSLQPASLDPGDPNYAKYQWNLKAPTGRLTVAGARDFGGSDVNHAWPLADGRGIVIAVLDTGITTHVDVKTGLASAGYDFITDSLLSGRKKDGRVPGAWDQGDWTTSDPWLTDCSGIDNPPHPSSWHGTHVASTAGAERNGNGIGLAGVAYHARILPVRVLGHCGGYDSDIADAIVWAAGGHVDGVPDNTHPAQVINLSLGGYGQCGSDDPMGQAIARANQRGVVVVVSAGNDNDKAAMSTPASCPGTITVASVGVTSRRAFYSNYGKAVDLAAPGGGIYANDASSGTEVSDGFVWQAINSGKTTPVPDDDHYAGYAGTSQAAPHVSGVVAMMQGVRKARGLPLLSPSQVLNILRNTASAPTVAPDHPIGAGILDAYAAVQNVINRTK
jgi:serine protease